MYNQNFYGKTPVFNNYRDNRLIGGGFAVPFVLGGITGGLLAPAFYPRPYYYPAPPPPRPYPYYS